jgi:hypothetical protein
MLITSLLGTQGLPISLLSIVNSEVKKRREQINGQLDRVRLRLALKSAGRYTNEGTYKYQRRRADKLIAELEDELSMLAWPGEYAELAVATVADELGITCKQVRGLIKSGEIEATGNAAHERISRTELERIAVLGAAELLRLARQESADIFKEAVPHLQSGDLELSERAYRRLKGRGAWGEAYAPTFLLCLEIVKGEFESARDSIRLIQECNDPFERAAIVDCLRRLLTEMHYMSNIARKFCEPLLMGAKMSAPPARGTNRFTSEYSNEGAEGV